jgi:hypothetical protein
MHLWCSSQQYGMKLPMLDMIEKPACWLPEPRRCCCLPMHDHRMICVLWALLLLLRTAEHA